MTWIDDHCGEMLSPLTTERRTHPCAPRLHYKGRGAQVTAFAVAQHDPSWLSYRASHDADLTTLLCQDVTGLVQDPWSRTSTYLVELSARKLFSVSAVCDAGQTPAAVRWNRYMLQVLQHAIRGSEWVNQPGPEPGLRPAILMPWGDYIGPPLAAVLDEHADSPRRGRVVLDLVDAQRQRHAEWVQAGSVCLEDFPVAARSAVRG